MFDLNLFHFKGQQSGEEVVVVIHRHWWNIVDHFLMIFLMMLFLIGSYTTLPALFPVLNENDFNAVFMFGESLFAMLVFLMFFLVWIDYYFDAWVITTRRVVNIEQKGLFSRDVSEVELDKIQDVTTEVTGVIPTFMNYGDVQIQTAGTQEKFLFRNVSDPYGIKDLLMRLQKEQKRSET